MYQNVHGKQNEFPFKSPFYFRISRKTSRIISHKTFHHKLHTYLEYCYNQLSFIVREILRVFRSDAGTAWDPNDKRNNYSSEPFRFLWFLMALRERGLIVFKVVYCNRKTRYRYHIGALSSWNMAVSFAAYQSEERQTAVLILSVCNVNKRI